MKDSTAGDDELRQGSHRRPTLYRAAATASMTCSIQRSWKVIANWSVSAPWMGAYASRDAVLELTPRMAGLPFARISTQIDEPNCCFRQLPTLLRQRYPLAHRPPPKRHLDGSLQHCCTRCEIFRHWSRAGRLVLAYVPLPHYLHFSIHTEKTCPTPSVGASNRASVKNEQRNL